MKTLWVFCESMTFHPYKQLFQVAGAKDWTTDPCITRPVLYPDTRGTLLDKILLKCIFVQSSGAFGVGQRQRAGNALSHSVFVNGDQRWRMKVVPNEKWFQYTIYYVPSIVRWVMEFLSPVIRLNFLIRKSWVFSRDNNEWDAKESKFSLWSANTSHTY